MNIQVRSGYRQELALGMIVLVYLASQEQEQSD
jgi:hypothetical protein